MADRESLRGVPFRLSKKFYPLIKPQFRDIDIHIPLDALEEDYDFSLERQMIVKHESFLEEKERLRIKHEERMQRIAEERMRSVRIAEEKRKQEELAAAAAANEAANQAATTATLVTAVNAQPDIDQILSSPPTTIESSLSSLNLNHIGVEPAGIMSATASQQNPPEDSVSSINNSFTKLHFPFLSSYTQTNTRDRELERALERSYHQHYQQQQLQRNISSSAPPTAVPGIGLSPALLYQPPIPTSSSASNLQNIPNAFNSNFPTAASGVNSSHAVQNPTHSNFIIGHSYNWPLTTTRAPSYEYSHLQQPTKK